MANSNMEDAFKYTNTGDVKSGHSVAVIFCDVCFKLSKIDQSIRVLFFTHNI